MVGLVVAFPNGIYFVHLEIGSRLRMRRLTDGRVMSIGRDSLKFMVAQRAAYVLARQPGRFAEMPHEALVAIHDRVKFKEIALCSFNPSQEP
jgi:hypothetical protein